jgi:hypothetical protein
VVGIESWRSLREVLQLFDYGRCGKESKVISRRVAKFKGRQFDRSVILLCVRWHLAYNLSVRDETGNFSGVMRLGVEVVRV